MLSFPRPQRCRCVIEPLKLTLNILPAPAEVQDRSTAFNPTCGTWCFTAFKPAGLLHAFETRGWSAAISTFAPVLRQLLP